MTSKPEVILKLALMGCSPKQRNKAPELRQKHSSSLRLRLGFDFRPSADQQAPHARALPFSTALHKNNSHSCDAQPLLRKLNKPNWDMRKRSANPAAQTKLAIQNQTTTIPKTGRPSHAADRVKSYVRNILLASPAFPRLYADVVISSAPNSHEAKILARNYQKIVERTSMPNFKNCTHIKVTGVRCGSPALRGEQFCYFHQRMLRPVKGPPASRVHHAALLEDEESIHASLIEIVNALLRGTIELKRAELILRALNTAVRNIRRVKFSQNANHMVTETPDYPTPPLEQVDEQYAAELQRHEARAAAG